MYCNLGNPVPEKTLAKLFPFLENSGNSIGRIHAVKIPGRFTKRRGNMGSTPIRYFFCQRFGFDLIL